MNYAHLPADKKAGFKVVGITDQNYEQAQRTAKEHSLAQVFASVDDLLRQPQIEIVDIAIYPAGTGDSSTDTPSGGSAVEREVIAGDPHQVLVPQDNHDLCFVSLFHHSNSSPSKATRSPFFSVRSCCCWR